MNESEVNQYNKLNINHTIAIRV